MKLCKRGLHDLDVPGARRKEGGCRECRRVYRQSEAGKAKAREYERQRTDSGRVAEYWRQRRESGRVAEYEQTPRRRAKRAEYRQSDAGKAKARAVEQKPKRKSQRAEYRRRRIREDPIHALRCRVSTHVWHTLKSAGFAKVPGDTRAAMGCSEREYYERIEAQFTEGMCWENRGETKAKANGFDRWWELDHKIPLRAGYGSREELLALFHFSNVQPLWKEDHDAKGGDLLPDGRRARDVVPRRDRRPTSSSLVASAAPGRRPAP